MEAVLHFWSMNLGIYVLQNCGWPCKSDNRVIRLLFAMLYLARVTTRGEIHLSLSRQNPKLTEVPSGLPSTILNLDLSFNDISELGADNFTGMSSMLKLNLAFNRIAHINNRAFISCLSLTYLTLSGNQIVHMPATFGPNSENIKKLNLDENPYIIESSWLQQFRSLGILRLECSAMGQFHSDMFNGLANLTNLALYNSKEPNLTARTVGLKALYLKDHRGRTYTEENFINLDKLTLVKMSGGDPMTTLPRFIGATALEEIQLDSFELESLPDLTHLTQLHNLVFPVNWMVCDHRLCWTLFESYTFSLGELERGCSHPPALRGRGIHSITKLELNCFDSKFLHDGAIRWVSHWNMIWFTHILVITWQMLKAFSWLNWHI